MKQELRCHAVLCPKEEKARQMATCLQERLHQVDTNTYSTTDLTIKELIKLVLLTHLK